jgi:MFS transporter, PHS family, inorganic phosphate transporter
MLALVFSAQPLGQFVSEVVAVICTASFKSGITSVPKADSFRATDRAWRLITGLGAIPAALALFSRLRIPESPRYYLEIENNSIKAESSVRERYNLGPSNFLPQIPLEDRHSAPNVPGTANNASHSVHGNAAEDPDTIAHAPLNAHTNADNSVPQEPLLNRPHSEYRIPNDPPQKYKASTADFRRYLLDEGGLFLLLGTSLSWFCMDFAFYGLGLSAPNIIASMAKDPQQVTDLGYWNFLANGPNAMLSVSVGALIGSFTMIVFVNKQSRKNVQMWGFVRLGLVFVIVGFSYDKLFTHRLWGLLILAYIIIQMFFNWGTLLSSFSIMCYE